MLQRFDDDYQDIRDGVRALCAEFPDTYHREIDAERGYPEAFVEALTKAGWMAALIPEDYGGSGLGLAEASVIMEEINRAGGNSGACHGQMYNMNTLVRHGSEAQRQAYLPKIAEGSLRLLPQRENFHHAELVTQRLPGIDKKAFDLGHDVAVGERSILAEVIDACFARPLFCVYARVEHQACRTPEFILQSPEVVVRVLVESHLARKLLCIQCPALDERAIAGELAKRGQAFQFLCERELEMMARRRLMVGDRREHIALHIVHIGKVRVVNSRSRSVLRGTIVERDAG